MIKLYFKTYTKYILSTYKSVCIPKSKSILLPTHIIGTYYTIFILNVGILNIGAVVQNN